MKDPNRIAISPVLKRIDADRILCPHCAKRIETSAYVIDVFRAIANVIVNERLSIFVPKFGTFSPGTFEGGPDCEQTYFKLFARTFGTIKFMASRSVIKRMSTYGPTRNPVQQNRAAEKKAAEQKTKEHLATQQQTESTDELED